MTTPSEHNHPTSHPNTDHHPRTRCGFCGNEVTDILAAGQNRCAECGAELEPANLASDQEPPTAASGPIPVLLLLLAGAAAGLVIAALPYLLAPLSLGQAPIGLVLAVSINACWWIFLAPLFAMAWADNLIRALGIRQKLPLAGLAPIYLAIPAFIIMLAAAWPVAWPILSPWFLGTHPANTGPTAAPSAHQLGIPTGQAAPAQPPQTP